MRYPSISPTGFHTVYAIYCRHSTDLLYIGVTGYRLKKRLNSNKWFKPRDMWAEPILHFADRAEAEDWEEYLICYFNPPKNKYLTSKGKGQKQSEVWVKKRVARRNGYKNTDSHNKKIGEANSIKVLCVETGEIFESMTAAARWCEGNNSKISKVVSGQRKTHKGYRWKLV